MVQRRRPCTRWRTCWTLSGERRRGHLKMSLYQLSLLNIYSNSIFIGYIQKYPPTPLPSLTPNCCMYRERSTRMFVQKHVRAVKSCTVKCRQCKVKCVIYNHFRVWENAIILMDFELFSWFSGNVPDPVLNMRQKVRISTFLKGLGLRHFHGVTSSIL